MRTGHVFKILYAMEQIGTLSRAGVRRMGGGDEDAR